MVKSEVHTAPNGRGLRPGFCTPLKKVVIETADEEKVENWTG